MITEDCEGIDSYPSLSIQSEKGRTLTLILKKNQVSQMKYSRNFLKQNGSPLFFLSWERCSFDEENSFGRSFSQYSPGDNVYYLGKYVTNIFSKEFLWFG